MIGICRNMQKIEYKNEETNTGTSARFKGNKMD